MLDLLIFVSSLRVNGGVMSVCGDVGGKDILLAIHKPLEGG